MKFSEYTNKDANEVLRLLKSSEGGLGANEANSRLKIYGPNEIRTREARLLDIFLRQFKSSFFYLLLIASLVAFLIGENIDGLIILIFVFINVFLGFFQEARAQKAVSLLKKYIPLKTRVLRNNTEQIIDKSLLVPGDVVLLEAGAIVPADIRILRTENLLIDESVLTGESVPVSKTPDALLGEEVKEIFEAKNILFAGTSVVSGEAQGVVFNTGKTTVLGEITKLVSGISKESIYEKNLFRFSRMIMRIVLLTITAIFLANLIIKGTTNFFDFLIFSIALVVSVIPEALPLIVTFTFSKGALEMARKKVVVKRLSAIEDLGDIEILCSDKTGTLTQNKLCLKKMFAADKNTLLLYGLLTSSYLKEEIESSLNPFDSALFKKASRATRQGLKEFKMIAEIPFDLARLRNSVLVEGRGPQKFLIVKGAPETILELCTGFKNDSKKEEIKRAIEKEGNEGKRVLAVAYKEFYQNYYSSDDEGDLVFLGLFSFEDSLKKTAKDAIQKAKKLGIKLKMITGDSKEVAAYVGEKVGLIKNRKEVIVGSQLDTLSDDNFKSACREYSVFARISPQTKYKIVESLQGEYEVGFLGEGINDAPALKIAHVAIAVSSASDVAREVSDIVLLQNDLSVIIDGVKQGRNIFSNINKYIKCTLASNFGNFYSIALISLIIPFLPMLPIQILLVNLLSDFPLLAVSSDKVDAVELKKPKTYQLNKVILLIVLLALTSTVFDFIFFGIFRNAEPGILQTLWFVESILTEIALIFSIRTSYFFLKTKAPSVFLSLTAILVAIVTSVLPFLKVGREIFHFTTPPLTSLFVVFFLVLGYFIVSELVKLIYFHYWRPQPKRLAT